MDKAQSIFDLVQCGRLSRSIDPGFIDQGNIPDADVVVFPQHPDNGIELSGQYVTAEMTSVFRRQLTDTDIRSKSVYCAECGLTGNDFGRLAENDPPVHAPQKDRPATERRQIVGAQLAGRSTGAIQIRSLISAASQREAYVLRPDQKGLVSQFFRQKRQIRRRSKHDSGHTFAALPSFQTRRQPLHFVQGTDLSDAKCRCESLIIHLSEGNISHNIAQIHFM